MKKFTVIAGIIVCGVLALGFVCKSSYEDRGISSLRTVEDVEALNCNVNQIFTKEDVEQFLPDVEEMLEGLSEDADIYIVKPLNHLRQYNFTLTQDVEVVEVLQGDALEKETVRIVSNGGIYDQKYGVYEYDNSAPIYFGLTNLLFPENEYLVFLEPLKTNAYYEVKHYNPADALFFAFNLTCDESTPISGGVNEIAYNDFGRSEFLCDSEETLEHLQSFKKEVIEKAVSQKQW
ncbi:MAG: hypothetical protein J6A94_00310 [Lachnospiraceae bacterium]|nr:hypothetical protein [Lachnospiraceae bacterium]